MADLNQVALTGNLAADAELRGEKRNVLAIRLASTGRAYVDDEWVDRSHFFNVTLFGEKRAQALEQYLKKGTRIAVSGRLDFSQWEKDDEKRSSVQVIAEDIVLLGSSTPREDVPSSS